MNGQSWLERVRHDLVKRLLWPARDRRDLGGPARPGELAARLIDDDGQAITPPALWNSLRALAPAGIAVTALDRFGAAILAADAAASAGDVHGVLALDPAFADLARTVKGAG